MVSTYLVQTWSIVYPLAHQYASFAINWLSVNTPLAYQYVRELIITILNNIYQLSPQTFDQIHLSIKDACHYVVMTTPYVWERVCDAAFSAGQITHAQILEGKSWLAQKMSG